VKTADDVLTVIEAGFTSECDVEDFLAGDHADEAVIVFEDGERWTVKVRPSRDGEGCTCGGVGYKQHLTTCPAVR